MGYGMSRLEDEFYEPEGQDTDGSSSVQVNDEFSKLHNDIFHMTRMRSGLSESIYKSMGTNRGIISTTKLLSGREVDCSGKGMFSSGDRAFVLGRYVPMNGPEFLDRMDSRAYVSQFSADGTLFVAGFQVCYAQPKIVKFLQSSSWQISCSLFSFPPSPFYALFKGEIIHTQHITFLFISREVA